MAKLMCFRLASFYSGTDGGTREGFLSISVLTCSKKLFNISASEVRLHSKRKFFMFVFSGRTSSSLQKTFSQRSKLHFTSKHLLNNVLSGLTLHPLHLRFYSPKWRVMHSNGEFGTQIENKNQSVKPKWRKFCLRACRLCAVNIERECVQYRRVIVCMQSFMHV